MEKAFGTAVARTPAKKGMARVALVDLKESDRVLLTECFRQFGIETVQLSAGGKERLRQEKFEACVLKLAKGADTVMEAARSLLRTAALCCTQSGEARERRRASRSMASMQCFRNLWSGPR